jgi:cytochrome P450 PksS
MSQLETTLDEQFTQLVTDAVGDPRPIYAELRRRAPVYRTPFGFWYVTSYELATTLGRDPGTWTVSAPSGGHALADSYAFDVMARMILTLDGPDHARLRRLVGTIFNPRGAERLRRKVKTAIEEQIDGVAGRREIDLVDDIAILMPTKVILDVLGIGHHEVERFVAVAESLIAMHEPTATAQTIAEADRVFREAADIVLELAEARRLAPEDDLMTALVEAGTDGERLSEEELVSMVLLLVVAGHETTANTLASGLYHLLCRPACLEQLRGDLSILPSAVEELLRFDAATRNSVARYATRDVELGGQLVRRGEKLFVGLHAANHDPVAFENPLELDLTRSPNPHVGFHVGPHYCLGAGLARMELQTALEALLTHYPTLELAADEVEWKRSFIIRGLESLPLRLGDPHVGAGDGMNPRR